MDRLNAAADDLWSSWGRESATHPFFGSRPTLRTSDGILIRESLAAWIVWGLASGLAGSFVLHKTLLQGALDLVALGISLVPLLLALLVVLWKWRGARKIVCGSAGGVVTLSSGISRNIIEIPLEQLSASLESIAADTGKKHVGKGRLVLRRAGDPTDLILMETNDDREVRTMYDALRGLLGERGTDYTTVKLTLADETLLQVSKLPIWSVDSTFPAMKLDFRGTDLAIFSGTSDKTLFGLLLLVIGLAAAFAYIFRHQELSMADQITGAMIGIPIALAGMWIMLGKKRILLNRDLKLALFQPPTSDGTKQIRGIAFDDIAAVQTCGRYVEGDSDSPAYINYGLNLVLQTPSGARINIMTGGPNRQMAEARQLAEFLKKPLVESD